MPERGVTFTDKKQAQEYAKQMRKKGFQVFTKGNKEKTKWTVYVVEKTTGEEPSVDLGDLLEEVEGERGVKSLEEMRKKTKAVGAEVERYGGKAVRKAMAGKEEPITGVPGEKVLGTTARHIAKHASMRKVIPQAAASEEGLTYVARIGKIDAPKITERYVGKETPKIVAEVDPAVAVKPHSKIIVKTERPSIAEPVPLKTPGKLTGIPYMKKKRGEEDEESSSNQTS